MAVVDSCLSSSIDANVGECQDIPAHVRATLPTISAFCLQVQGKESWDFTPSPEFRRSGTSHYHELFISKNKSTHRQITPLRYVKMHLMYTLDANGKRQYTLNKIVDGEVTKSAHPARFSPDDKYSRYVISTQCRREMCAKDVC